MKFPNLRPLTGYFGHSPPQNLCVSHAFPHQQRPPPVSAQYSAQTIKMSTKASQPRLPADLLLYIIDYLIATADFSPIAFPASHTITATLLSLTSTTRITHSIANRLLYTYCLYIDSPHRLQCLTNSLSNLPAIARPRILPPIPFLRYITSLYLAPFSNDTIDDLPTARSLYDLLSLISPSLRRLVIDIPLRSLYPREDHLNVRAILRSAFAKLTALEIFCSVRDELYLDCHEPPLNDDEPPVWSLWPKLRTLALFNPDVDDASVSQFWPYLGTLEHLQTLVLTRSDGLDSADIKQEWRDCCGDNERGLNVVIVNVESEHRVPMGKERWEEGDKLVVREVNVPISYYGDENNAELCQEWVKRRMLRGEPVDSWT
jgi:hypothetical protein